jgi:methionyl-tRNA synthetase
VLRLVRRLVNYISAIGYKSDEKKFQQWWPQLHLVGKDILTTHTVYWPTMLQACGVPQPQSIFAHGWWLMGGDKMSKSLGNVVNPMELADRYGVDAFRYFLMAEMVLGQDASFAEDSFVRRFNADLANDLGNLANRVINMTKRFCEGKIPTPSANLLAGAEEKALWDLVQGAVAAVATGLEEMRPPDLALGQVLGAAKAVNRYFEVKQPWTLGKQDDKGPINDVLYLAAESLRVTSQLLHPVMPGKMDQLRASLGLRGPCTWAELHAFGKFPPGREVREDGPLFPRVEREEPKATVAAAPAVVPPPAPLPEGLITYDDFSKVKLRTATILSAEKIAGADKLLKLQIRVGEEQRQLVAGIALHYAPEALIGKTVVVVANLKPAKIRGVESNGMLLAASVGDQLKLVTIEGELPPWRGREVETRHVSAEALKGEGGCPVSTGTP